jgi:adenylate cyclase
MTLARLLAVTSLGVAILVALLSRLVLQTSEETILRASEQQRSATARRIGELVHRDLDDAARAVLDVERIIISGAHGPDLEATLYAELIDRPRLAELCFTFADRSSPLSQLAIERGLQGEIATRRVLAKEGGFVLQRRDRGVGAPFEEGTIRELGATMDPREHLTYSTTASIADGRLIWSDLAYAEIDSALPEPDRRVVVSAQKLIRDRRGRPVGVVRAALDTKAVDEIARGAVEASDPHRIFITDDRGRLITRFESKQPIVEIDGDLRPDAARLPPSISLALSSPLPAAASKRGEAAGDVYAGGQRWLVTFRALPESQDWLVGIVVPAVAYTKDLEPLRARLALFSGAVLLAVIFGGVLTVLPIQRSLARIVGITEGMRRFDFVAQPSESLLADVRDVLESLERAKTALRALGKFVPIDLVRELYRDNREPVLGGELRTLSIMFTDIKDFTTVSEKMSPDALAQALGLYLEAMTRAIQNAGGTIDKFVGDAVMAIWNAPSPAPNHAVLACRAALACRAETARLYARPDWGDRPRFYTRFGLHQDRVMVGNFGAPDRMGYTALGDGVNLAARLEGLCKQYGVAILVSEAIAYEARSDFAFRKIDRVAVKGRSAGVTIYELMSERSEIAERYEDAFEAYVARDFDRAIALLRTQAEDPPSAVLLERCRAYRISPPPSTWDGIFVATSK